MGDYSAGRSCYEEGLALRRAEEKGCTRLSTQTESPANSGSVEVSNEVNARARREFLRGLTVVAGTGFAAAVLGAQTTTPPGGTPTPSPANDLTILGFALTLELLEATFYTQGLMHFTSADFASSAVIRNLTSSSGADNPPPAGDVNTGLAQDVYAYFSLIRDHEQQHVRTIRQTIQKLGGTPPPTAPTFKISYSNVDDFLTTAALLETTGVAAYNGALNVLYNPAVVTAAATIATVEGRHSAYVNRVLGQNAFPNAFDLGKSAAEILAVVGPFLG